MTEDLDLETIREHYARIAPVMEELADVDDHLTIGLNDYSGWYVRRSHDDFDLLEEGYEKEARCATLATDYDTVQDRIERALYAVTTYKSRDAFVDWEPFTFEDGQTEWQTDSPTPGYGDLCGVMAWGDIDLADELKPQRGDLDENTQQVIDETLEAYIDEYARLYGDRDAVFALDSVGGSYVMGAPAATLPIAELFDEDTDARGRLMEAFVDRSNEWLKDAQDRVEERVDGAAEVIDPDWVNNCNRQYKAPLSLHTDHDAVVVPLNTDSPSYELVSFDDVDEDLIETTASWAADLTSTEYRDYAETLVKRLWPDEYEKHGDWQAALTAWVEAESEREERQEEARLRARERRRERKEQMGGGVEGAPVTPFISDVFDALDALDIEDVADRTIVHQWTERASGLRDNSGSGKRAFVPVWGPNAEGGNANFIDLSEGIWVDTGDDYSGGPVKMALIAEENWNRGKTPSGDDWRRGVDHLRSMGFEIPVWTPDANSQDSDGEEYEQMPYWSVRNAAVALGVLPEEGFIRAHTDRGGYLRFPGKETYNHALAAIDDAGLEHGREYMTDDGSRPDDLEQSADDSDQDAPPAPSPASEDDRSAPVRNDDQEGEDAEEESGSNSFRAYSELDIDSGGYGYWHTNQETGDTWFERVTNFTLDVDSFLFKDGDRIIDMTVVPSSGEDTYDLTVPAKVFNDARRFRDNVVVGLSTTFDGSPSDLNELRKLVASQDAPQRQGTHHMGLHPGAGEFVTPNGVLTADGWTDDPQTAYIERDIGAERSNLLDPEEIDDYDAEDVASILELLPQSRNSDRFLPVLGWLYTAPLRPYVDEWEGQFNTLHVTGETGAGKSSTLSLAWQLLGMDGDPMACDDTKFALTTNMASSNSIPMWFDEYKPGDMKDWELDRFQNLMRKSTRGGVETRGNADKSTEEYRLEAPLMISGEQAVQGAAEERRSIQTRFRDNVKDPGSSTKQAFARLTGMAYDDGGETREPDGYDLQQHALAYYRYILQEDEETLHELWRSSRDYVRELLTKHDITGVDDLPRQGIQTVHFGMTLYSHFAEYVAAEAGVETLELPTSDEIDTALLYVARQFGDGGSRKSHLDRFVELASRAAEAEYLEEKKHYTVVHEGTPEEQLALKLPLVHDSVSKYVRDHGLTGEDLLNTAGDYQDRMKEAAKDGSTYVDTHSKNTRPLSRCARLDTTAAEEQLEFDASAFGLEPKNLETDEETTEDAESGGSNPTLNELEPGRHTIEATVAEKLEPKPWLQGEGTLVDGDTVSERTLLDYVARGDTDPLAKADSGDRVRITNAKVTTNDDGLKELELTGVCDVEILETPDVDQSSLEDESTAAATDGGAEGLEGTIVQRITETVEEAEQPVGLAYIVRNTEGKGEQLREALTAAVEAGRIHEWGDDKYAPGE